MKTKKITLAFIIMLASISLRAQINYGIHAGLNLVTQAKNGQLWNNCDLYQGFLIGGFLEYKPFNTISFQTEINYQKKGSKVSRESGNISTVTKNEMNYISVPLLIRANIKNDQLGDRYNLTFFAGPYAGYLVSSSARMDIGGESRHVNHGQYEDFDFGAVFGGGIIYNLTNNNSIIGELRYEMGMAGIDKVNPGLRNKGMGLTVGYRF